MGSKTQARWGYSCRTDLDLMDRSSADLEFDVDNEGSDLSASVDARVTLDTTNEGGSPSFNVKRVKGSCSRTTN